MKSIFTKLSTLLLCGAVAMVSCTDFSEDIQNLDNKVDNLGNTTQTELATLQKAITDLEAKLSAQYATKDEVAALKTTLENSIASEVAALSEDIAEVSAALNAAKNEINTAIAGLDEKKADKTAVEAAVKTATEAIAALQAELEAAKGDLEAEIASVKEQIAATQESLQEKINGVDAKANELQNTLLSLGDYLKTLEAKVNEINNTLLSLGEYLPTIEAKILEVKGTVESLGAEYEANKVVVDAKLNELFSTLVSLSNHLEEYEATTDFKLVELQGSLAALSTYLEEYEASVDAKFNEILNTFESLSLFLDDKFAALDATDTDLYKEIDGIRVVLTALNNLLADETAAREAEDGAIYELIGSSVTALNNLISDLQAEDEALYVELEGVREAFTTLNNLLNDEAATREAEDAALYELIGTSVTALNNLIADLEAEDEAIYAEIENVRTYVAQVYNALSTEIAAVDAALQAHIAAFEAFKEAYEAKVDELEATDENLYVEINGLREVITTINNHIDDLRAEDEAIYLEINGLRENLTQLQNAINNRIDEEVKTLKDEILEKFNILNTVILETEKRVNDKFNHTLKLIAENTELILANAAAIADLEAAVEMLMDWVAGQEENNELQAELIAKVYEIVGEMEEQIAALTQKDNELEGLIGKTAGALQTYMDENDARLADLELFINENINSLGAGIRNLEAIINDLEARFGARLDALEERMDAAEGKIADLEDQAAAMAKAIENIEAAIEDLKAMDEALAAEIANVDAAAKAELKKARKELQDQIDALVEAKEDLQVRVAVLEELVADNTANIENNRKEIEANITAISNAVKQLGSLQATVNAMIQSSAIIDSALQAKDIELQKNIDAAVADLAAAVARIGAVEDAVKALQELAETLATKAELKDEVAKIEKKMTDIQNMLLTLITASEDRANDKIEHLRGLVADANELIAGLRGDVDNLAARVQSLVYVPEYADHKATIEWATITTGSKVDAGFAIPTIIAKTSDLKYLVKAENAAEVASAIAANWSKVLDYNVTDVKTRGAAVSGADLEIVNVVADGEYIVVSVVAKNFSTNFFEKNKQGGIYSAALVLADGNNTRTSEYTNLVPGTPAEFQMNLFVSAEDAEVAAESLRMTENHEVISYKMPCNDTELVKSAVKPMVGFVPVVDGEPVITTPVRFYTPELLAEEGYDLAIETAITIVDCENQVTHDGTMDTKPDYIKIDPYFNIEGGNPVNDYHYTVKEGVSFDNVGKYSTVEYEFTCGNVSSSLTYKFELANAQVDINIIKNIPWSIAFAEKYIDGKKLYRFDAVADASEVTVAGADGFSDLKTVLSQKSAANTAYYVMGENGWAKTSVKHIPFQNYTADNDANFALVDYSFNNSYKVVYTTTSGNVDYNTSIVVNLTGYKKEVTVNVPVDFVLDGKVAEFVAPVALADYAYAELTNVYDYLGYGEDNAETWAAMFASYVEPYAAGNLGFPYVNGKKSNWVRNLNKLSEARLMIEKNQVVDGENTITWEVNPVNDFTVKFVVSGEITKPAGSLIYADSYVEHGVAEAKGQLEKNEEGVLEYSIIESHLPFYFNATAIDYDAHDYTVKFEVKENTKVTLSNDVVSVLAKDGSYYPLENNAILDWAKYTGLEVEVVATLYANGYQIDQKELKIITKDPLHFTVGNVEAQRVMREDVTVQLFQNAVLTSSIEPEKENLISFLTSTGALKSIPFAFEYAKSTYGVDVRFVLQDPTAESHVYYFDNTGKKTYLAKTQYDYDEGKGHLTIKGDDAVAKNYYADFTAIMSSRICSGEHRVNFQVKFVGTK